METMTERGRLIVGGLTEQGRFAYDVTENGQILLGTGETFLTPTPILSGSFVTDHIALTWVSGD